MPEAYDLHEARFIQYLSYTTAVNGTLVLLGPVPSGKVWTILSGSLYPSVNETQSFWWGIRNPAGTYFQITTPTSLNLNTGATAFGCPILREGMEIKLYPGEYLTGHRSSNTAGSTLSGYIRFIESDLPFYSYSEPLKKVVEASKTHGSVYRNTGGISTGGSGTSGGSIVRGGKTGGSEPI
jgi:hypothetical protein